ncbi:MAG: thiamine pyrophosphate-binding protein [Acidobacteriota bacterium]|nr:thiamine pyrophosphate-binding protein [Acidobacteriota bacterium]
MPKRVTRKPDQSRRNFLQKAVAGAGATAAAALTGRGTEASAQTAAQLAAGAVAPIRVPAEFAAATAAKPVSFEFPMTGAQVFARACKEEGVAALFACPGNYGIVHALAASGIPAYGGRHEGSMAHAADAFIRVTGEIAVASGTEGPGFTDMICAIACANAARTPLLIVASNMSIAMEDTEAAIQLAYQQPTTEGMKKYGKRLIVPRRVHEYTATAFRQLKSGVPKPVHLDFPAEVASARFKDASELEFFHDKARYRTDSRPHPSAKDIGTAVDLIRKAERPMIVSSNGVFYAKAWDALKRLAEKAQIPVVESGAMKGQFSDASPLSANAAPAALPSADLVILVGQHCMPTVGEFAFGPDAKYIRIDQAHEDLGRNLPIDLGMVSCERAALEALADAVPAMKHDAWLAEVAAARKRFEDQNAEYYKTGLGYTDAVHPAVIAKQLGDFLYRGNLPREQTTVASGGYGIARFVRRELRAFRPGQIMNGAYQYGAIGPDLGYAVGVAAAVQLGVGPQAAYKGHPIICITGDAGFGYTAMEIDTMAKYKLPVVAIVYNNNAWGTWTGAQNEPKALPIHLFQENLRYDKLAESLGGHGEYVTKAADFTPALARAYQVAAREGKPAVINCQGRKEFWDRAKYPPGMIGKVEPGLMSYYH